MERQRGCETVVVLVAQAAGRFVNGLELFRGWFPDVRAARRRGESARELVDPRAAQLLVACLHEEEDFGLGLRVVG